MTTDSFTSQGMRIRSLFGRERTEGHFAFVEIEAPPGYATPLHQHSREDEVMYIVAGEVRVRIGDALSVHGPGDNIVMPRNVPHAWAVVGESPLRFVGVESPSGFEVMLEELSDPPGAPPSRGPDVARLRETAPRFGIAFIAPPGAWQVG